MPKKGLPRLWKPAIDKEMTAVMIAFEFVGRNKPEGYKVIRCHLIFDIKMNLTRKARIVAEGNRATPDADVPVYASVVSRESVRILFAIASLNNLKIRAADITNAFLNAPCLENICFKAGPEFGDKEGQWVIVRRALYGLVSSSAAFAIHRNQVLYDMGFLPCEADPDVWMRRSKRKDGQGDYYEYIAAYVDDVLAISENPDAIMKEISEAYDLKKIPGQDLPWESPKQYLGADVGYDAEQQCWCTGAQTYIENTLKTVQSKLKEKGLKLNHNANSPYPTNYRPELDMSDYLDKSDHNLFQQFIGILNWIIELGRIESHNAVARLSAFLAAPRVGHLRAALHIFSFLKQTNNLLIPFDMSLDDLPDDYNKTYSWERFYPDAFEIDELPPKMPEPLGPPVRINCFVDADHAGDQATRRSYTGIILMINKAWVSSFSKRQNTVEAATFGSEIIAARLAKEKVQALFYKLRMMGIKIDGPAIMHIDNNSVVNSVSFPESKLKKKHLSVCYHAVREAIAANVIRVCWIVSAGSQLMITLLTFVLRSCMGTS